MSGQQHFARAAAGVATRAELDQRLAARPKPRAERHLTIGGTQEHMVHAMLDAANERRIRYLQERLESLRTGIRHDQAQARLTGKARGDFERTR
jgi:hypothetical protein